MSFEGLAREAPDFIRKIRFADPAQVVWLFGSKVLERSVSMFPEAENRLTFEPDDLAIGIEGIGRCFVTEPVETVYRGGKIFVALDLSQENIGSSLGVGFGTVGTFELAVAVKAQGG